MIRPDNLTGMAKASYDEYLRELALLLNVPTMDKPSFFRHVTEGINDYIDDKNINTLVSTKVIIMKEGQNEK